MFYECKYSKPNKIYLVYVDAMFSVKGPYFYIKSKMEPSDIYSKYILK